MKYNNNDLNIDREKANRLHLRVFDLEKKYHRAKNTKNFKITEADLISTIIKLISAEVKNDN